MASKQTNWLTIFSDFVRNNPKTSAAIAFNLGVVAARATKNSKAFRSGVIEIPAKLIELVPSVKDLGAYVPLIGNGRTAAKPKRRGATRNTAARRAASGVRKKAAG